MDLSTTTHELEADRDLLVGRDEGDRVKDLVCRRLKDLPPQHVLRLDFRRVQFVDVSGADEVVVKVVGRVIAGEFPDRFIVITGVGTQHRENIEMALGVAKKAVLVDLGSHQWTILGPLNAALRRVLVYIGMRGAATARELVDELDIDPINTASTRLTQLFQEGLCAREPWREPVRGGGRQFRYIALCKGEYVELQR
jgi:hypothetical protein